MKSRIKILRNIEEEERIPKWYGLVGWDYDLEYKICALVPINIIIKGFNHCRYALKKGLFKSKYEAELKQAYRKGINARDAKGFEGQTVYFSRKLKAEKAKEEYYNSLPRGERIKAMAEDEDYYED